MNNQNNGKNSADWVRATDAMSMTHCDKCMRQVPMNDNIMNCPYCGAEIHEPTGPICPKCGTQMQDDEDKCVVCKAEIPGRYDKKMAKRFLSWMIYKKPNGLYGIGILGWIVLTIVVIAVMCIYGLFQAMI